MARELLRRVGADQIAYLQHDSYYKDLSALDANDHSEINFDHPNALETELLIAHIGALRDYRPVQVPIYDFATDTRKAETIYVSPKNVILVEGILLYAEPELRKLFDVKIFVDADADIRFIRRLHRDINERGRSVESVIEQYYATVRPMHLEFVEPSKRYADVIIPEGGHNVVAMDMVVARIEMLLNKSKNLIKEN